MDSAKSIAGSRPPSSNRRKRIVSFSDRSVLRRAGDCLPWPTGHVLAESRRLKSDSTGAAPGRHFLAAPFRAFRSRRRRRRDDRFGPERPADAAKKAIAPRMPLASSGWACASSGRSSRPPAAARQLRPWQSSCAAPARRTSLASPRQSPAPRWAENESNHPNSPARGSARALLRLEREAAAASLTPEAARQRPCPLSRITGRTSPLGFAGSRRWGRARSRPRTRTRHCSPVEPRAARWHCPGRSS